MLRTNIPAYYVIPKDTILLGSRFCGFGKVPMQKCVLVLSEFYLEEYRYDKLKRTLDCFSGHFIITTYEEVMEHMTGFVQDLKLVSPFSSLH